MQCQAEGLRFGRGRLQQLFTLGPCGFWVRARDSESELFLGGVTETREPATQDWFLLKTLAEF